MREKLAVGVSPETFTALKDESFPDMMLVPLTGNSAEDVAVIWRRQVDRTAWLVDAVARSRSLEWIHTDTAGVDRLPMGDFAARGIVLTNARGVHAPAVSAWALGAMLMVTNGLDRTVRNSVDRLWSATFEGTEIPGRTVLILGAGSIGAALSGACRSLGMRVVGVSRTRRHSSSFDRSLALTDDWLGELAGAAFLVNCLPLTQSTESFVNRELLEALPSDAWFINVGRGETVDEGALVAAIDGGQIAGAVLDTVREEPLAPGSALWGRTNLIIGAHRSSFTDKTSTRTMELFRAQVALFLGGAGLRNVVDYAEGY